MVVVMETARGLIYETRPKQWVKQVFVFVPLLFSGRLLVYEDALSVIIAAAAFSVCASAIYIWNDIIDRHEDRKHPRKKHRPIASGQVSVPVGAAAGTALLLIALIVSYIAINYLVFSVLVAYCIQNIVYNLKGREIVYVDLFIISFGYVLRALAGVYAISGEFLFPSSWLLICTFLTSLLLGLGKREKEIRQADGVRSSSSEYNGEVLLHSISVVSSCLVITYSLYSLSGTKEDIMVLTVPFGIFAVLRYLHLLYEEESDTVYSLLYSDTIFVFNLVLWTATVAIIKYLQLNIVNIG